MRTLYLTYSTFAEHIAVRDVGTCIHAYCTYILRAFAIRTFVRDVPRVHTMAMRALYTTYLAIRTYVLRTFADVCTFGIRRLAIRITDICP